MLLLRLCALAKEEQKFRNEGVAQCGRLLAVLRHALSCLGHTWRGADDSRHPLATTRRAKTAGVGH